MTTSIYANGLCAALLGVMTIAGYLSPISSFGRWVAPYILAGTICLLLPIIAMVIVRQVMPS